MMQRRIDFYSKWLKGIPSGVEILDIGDSNWVTEGLNKYLWKIVNTQGNLNFHGWEPREPRLDPFKYVFCFEVIEHLQNPLLFLGEVRKRMQIHGTLYLTTPRESLRILKMPQHFIEFDLHRLLALFELTQKFKVVDCGLTGAVYPWFIFWKGFRPLLRALFQKSFYLEAVAL